MRVILFLSIFVSASFSWGHGNIPLIECYEKQKLIFRIEQKKDKTHKWVERGVLSRTYQFSLKDTFDKKRKLVIEEIRVMDLKKKQRVQINVIEDPKRKIREGVASYKGKNLNCLVAYF